MQRHGVLTLLLLWLLTLLACGIAAAAGPAPGMTRTQAPPRTFVLAPDDCRQLADAVPAPDVEYRPGIDADGGAVAPADLPGGAHLRLPDAFPIGINVYIGDPRDLPGVASAGMGSGMGAGGANAPARGGRGGARPPAAPYLYAPEAMIGEVAVVRAPSGYEFYFNGEPLADPVVTEIRRACAAWTARPAG